MNIQGLDPGELAARRDEILNHFSRIDLKFDRSWVLTSTPSGSLSARSAASSARSSLTAGTANGIKNSEESPMRVPVAGQLPGTYLQRPVVKSD